MAASSTLTNWAQGVALAARTLTLACASRGNLLVDDGHRRLAAGRWTRRDGGWTSTTVTFGPFVGPVDIDALRLYDGDQLVDTQPFGRTVQLTAGMTFTVTFEVDDV